MIQNRKRYRFNLHTVYVDPDNDICVKRASYYNTLYIYVYERSLFRTRVLLVFKVVVNE